jgi:alpha-L-fucosidase
MIQDWFTDAKLGVFIHWGIYSVQRQGDASWPIVNGLVSYDNYLAQTNAFTASHYDPDAWADLFAESGAGYAVLTTKHHDGVTLWPTALGSPHAVAAHPEAGDLVGRYVDALRKKKLRVGLYFSHTDWFNRDHLSVLTGHTPDELLKLRAQPTHYFKRWVEDQKAHNRADMPVYRASWERFLAFHQDQIDELLSRYAPVDLLWFDCLFDRSGFAYDTAALRERIHAICPTTVINSRLGPHGDYETPEQALPVHPPAGPWEFCCTLGDSWSYTGPDSACKSPFELITMFCECLGMGGNLLVNVGPDPEGVIPPEQAGLLRTLGAWIRKHREAVHGTVRGLPAGYAYHHSALNQTRDTLYLYVAHPQPQGTPIKGIKNNIKRIHVLGTDYACASRRVGGAPWIGVPGALWIDVPVAAQDPHVTVVKIELDGPLDLHDGDGVEITQN